MTQNTGFLQTVFDGKPDSDYILVWTKQGQEKRSAWFTDPSLAEQYAIAQRDRDTWFGVALSPADYGPTFRCKSDQVTGIGGLWADLDVLDPAHKAMNLCPNKTEALNLLHRLPLRPTVVVDSGHGLQPYWLFKEPWLFETPEDRQAARELEDAWLETIRTYAPGWAVDDVADLARILRVPGTTNHKGTPVVVNILENSGPRYDPSEFEEYLRIPEKRTPPRPTNDTQPVKGLGGAYWLASAIKKANAGNRHEIGKWLAVQLRAAGLCLTDALLFMDQYADHCEELGSCDEPAREHMAKLLDWAYGLVNFDKKPARPATEIPPLPDYLEDAPPNDSPPGDAPSGIPSRRARKIGDHEQGLARLGYTFRLNCVTGKLEVNGHPLDDPTMHIIRAKMRDAGYANALALEDVVWLLGKQNEYHPIRSYLLTCGMAYDGNPNIATVAAGFHDVTAPHALFGTWLRRWLIGAVAKVMHDGDVHNSMLVLDGPQLLGKSYFASWLASGLPQYFARGRIDPDNKDCHLRYGENFIWETAELGATTRRADIDALKEFISAETVTVRRPYDKYDTKRPALCSLIGTINNSGGFLADTTGNRRFLVAHIKQIDWGYSEDAEVSQVWGEAFTAYQNGETWLPTRDELALSEENNETYMLPNPLEGYLDRYFAIDPGDKASWASTGDIVARLVECGYRAANSRALAMEVAATLSRMGCKKRKSGSDVGRVWGYEGVTQK